MPLHGVVPVWLLRRAEILMDWEQCLFPAVQ
jgi:hypothetical protein